MASNENVQSDEDPFGHGGGMDCDSDTAITHNVTQKDPPEACDPEHGKKPKARNVIMNYIKPPIGDIAKRWWEVLITGAIRTCERLHSADIKYKGTNQTVLAECQICEENVVENNDHIFWGCQNPKQKEIRKRLLETLGKIANRTSDPEEARITRDPELWPKSLRTMGIMPKCMDAHGFLPPAGGLQKNMPLMPLLGAKTHAHLDPFIEEWLLGEPFTDGACSNQETDFARAGFVIHYYPKCSRNVALPLEGNYQGSDRAELKAAVLSLERHRWGKNTHHDRQYHGQ
jgi:hypothetical protein